jgi:hypothetical protein
MRLVAKKGLVTAMAAGGVLAAAAGYAQADSGAQGTSVGSPGLLSGDLVQLPVHVPVNVCGNTVNVVGVLNPAYGNACANTSSGTGAGGGAGTGSTNSGGAHAGGSAAGSPGVGSGLTVQLPVHVPVNVSGNSVGAVSVLNPTTGNTSVNGSAPAPVTRSTPPAAPVTPKPVAHPVRPETAHVLPARASLAHTGAGGIGYEAAASAVSLLGGLLLYRRFRPGRRG